MSKSLRLSYDPEMPEPTPDGEMASIVWFNDEEAVVPSELEDEDELFTRVP
jgi:hypothetical protein